MVGMRASGLPLDDELHLATLQGASCRLAPRDERFDRVTRTLRRLLRAPMALITVVDEGRQLLRSTQGLDTVQSLGDLAFCGQAALTRRPVLVPDLRAEPLLAVSPLVTGPLGLRSYVGWPLEVSPGIIGGALCALDTVAREFSDDELAGIRDLARMAECELTAHVAATQQKSLLTRLDLAQRRHALDPYTGTWSIRGFRELLGVAVPQTHAEGSHLALCHLRIDTVGTAYVGMGEVERTSVVSVLAQLLRERLPSDGALARIGPIEFCALVQAPSAQGLERLLAPIMATEMVGVLPDGHRLVVSVQSRVVRLSALGEGASASQLWSALTA
jgi:GGDEF domain-containing protein